MPTKGAIIVDLTGQRFGRLIAYERRMNAKGKVEYLCHCDCGAVSVVHTSNLQKGRTQSCGCLRRYCYHTNSRTHGHSPRWKHSPTYNSWNAMMIRCHNTKAINFGRYGGRGISVCRAWRTFASFLNDMGERPIGRTLDRIDNRFGYFYANCRWSTLSEQSLNRRWRMAK